MLKKHALRVIIFTLQAGALSWALGPVLALSFGYTTNSLTPDKADYTEVILLSWMFGWIFALIPAVISLVLNIASIILPVKNTIKNIMIFTITQGCIAGAFIALPDIASELGTSLPVIIIGYCLPVILLFLIFKPIKMVTYNSGNVIDRDAKVLG